MSDRKSLCKSVVSKRLRRNEPLWGGWKLTHFIGAGAHGCVFRIERETLGQNYVSALKVIPLEKSTDSRHTGIDSLQRALGREAEEILLLYRLGGHSNIVSWQDHDVFYEKTGNSVIADIVVRMEYLPDSLALRLAKGMVTCDEAMPILSDCLDGLSHIHAYGVIHRDLKPENIFLDSKGQAKIGDFGVARAISASARARTFTGTPLYMAPEVFTNPMGKGHDHRVDIYSMGLVAYEMLEGQLPFQIACDYDEAEMVEKRLSGTPLEFTQAVPDHVQRAISRACALNPEDRFGAAQEFKAALLGESVPHRRMESKTVSVFDGALPEYGNAPFGDTGGQTQEDDPFEREDKIAKFMNEGDFKRATGKWEEAVQSYEKVLELDPGHPTARKRWKESKIKNAQQSAMAAESLEETKKALDIIRDAIRLFPDAYSVKAQVHKLEQQLKRLQASGGVARPPVLTAPSVSFGGDSSPPPVPVYASNSKSFTLSPGLASSRYPTKLVRYIVPVCLLAVFFSDPGLLHGR